MIGDSMGLTSSQSEITDELYVRTADENYITARWCSIQRLHTDFAWSSVHALEKYLKAVLLYNGKPATKHGHDIVALYDSIKPIAVGLLPTVLTRPTRLGIGHWCDKTPDDFLKHLYENGNADNRYLVYGHDTRNEDLHMLDSMVFAIRRLVCRLDEPMVNPGAIPPKSRIPTNREMLSAKPRYQPNQFMPLDDCVRSKKGDASRNAALNLNFEFAPEEYQHTDVQGGDSSRTPVLFRRILEPLGSGDPGQVQNGIETVRWLLGNVTLPGDVRKQIGAALESAELRIQSSANP
jgi:hypothetical protein